MYDKNHLALLLEEFIPLRVHALEKKDYELYAVIVRIENMLRNYAREATTVEELKVACNTVITAWSKTYDKVHDRIGSPKNGYLLISI